MSPAMTTAALLTQKWPRKSLEIIPAYAPLVVPTRANQLKIHEQLHGAELLAHIDPLPDKLPSDR